MNEERSSILDFSPVKLLEAGNQLELGLLVAKEFIENKNISVQELRETLKAVPFSNNLPLFSWPVFLSRAEAANKISEELRPKFFSTIAASLTGESALSDWWNLEKTLFLAKAGLPEINQPIVLRTLEYFLLFPNYITQAHRWSEIEYLAAAARLGCEFLGHWYASDSRHESAGKNLYPWILYEATIHDLLIGVKTNCGFFAESPEEIPPQILNSSKVICHLANEKELRENQIRSLLSGTSVSPVYKTPNSSFFVGRK